MLHTLPRDARNRDEEGDGRAVFWSLVIAAAVAAALLLLLARVGFEGLDRLLPDGQPFLPYFTT
jgi:hypothetical protein